MKVVVAKDIDTKISNLEIIETKLPKLFSDEVLVDVKSASLNPLDLKIIENKIIEVNFPYVLGIDICGIVVKTHKNSFFKVGDKVMGHKNMVFGGGLSEYAKINENILVKLDNKIDFNYGAAMAYSGLVALECLTKKTSLEKKSTIFINGGDGGVGGYIILIAKKLGYRILSCVQESKKDYIEHLGAEYVNPKKDLLEQVLALNRGSKVDMAIELVDYNNIDRDLDLIKYNGFMCSIVGYSNVKYRPHITYSDVSLAWAYISGNEKSIKDLGIMGQKLFSILGENASKIYLNIFPLEHIQQAFECLKSPQTKGKVVIDFGKK